MNPLPSRMLMIQSQGAGSAGGLAEIIHIAIGRFSKSVLFILSAAGGEAGGHLSPPTSICLWAPHGSPWQGGIDLSLLTLFLALSFTGGDRKQSLDIKIEFRFTFILR